MPNDNKKKIYVIDDDETHLITAELFLKDEYELRKAISGQEALDCINNNEFIPSLVLLDLLMPKMDGWEVYKRLREMEPLKDVPIAFLTSLEDAAEQKRAMKMGATDYIMKPYNMTELRTRVKEVFKKHETKKPIKK